MWTSDILQTDLELVELVKIWSLAAPIIWMFSTTIWFVVASRDNFTAYYVVAWFHVLVTIVTVVASYPSYKELILGLRSEDDEDEQFPEFK